MPHDREIELKLEIEPQQAQALSAVPQLGMSLANSKQLASTYFDTKKNGLRKAGVSLRVRRSGERFVQTVKLAGEGAGLFSRSEWEWDVSGPRPDRDLLAGTPAADVLNSTKLLARFETHVERCTWIVEEADGTIEVALDRGVLTADGRTAPVCEIEIELKGGEYTALFTFADALAAAVPVRIGVLSKADRGFALAEDKLGMITKAPAVKVSPDLSVRDGFAVIAHACLKHFRLNEAPLVRDRDPDGLHQARVAMRRLRSALSLFRPALVDEDFDRIREELRWFTGQLGEARNLDVMIQTRGTSTSDGGAGDLCAAREQAYDGVIAAADSRRFRHLMLDLVRWAETGDWRASRKARRRLPQFAVKRLDRLWGRVSASGDDPAALGEEERHRLRIEIKKLRYASEFLAGLFPERSVELKRFTKTLQALQESLGYLNDMVTARAILSHQPHEMDEPLPRPHEGTLRPDEADREREHLKASRKALRQLIKMGPFWQTAETRLRPRDDVLQD